VLVSSLFPLLTHTGRSVPKPEPFPDGECLCQVAGRRERAAACEVRLLVEAVPCLLWPDRGRERHHVLSNLNSICSIPCT
jgi:hypothetical protein